MMMTMSWWNYIMLTIALLGVSVPGLCASDMHGATGKSEEEIPFFDEPQKKAIEHQQTPAEAVDADLPGVTSLPEERDSSEDTGGPALEEPREGDFWARMERYHDETYAFSHRQVVRMNGWFVPRGEEPREVPPTRLRISLPGQVTLEPDNTVIGKVPLEADAEITLPDAQRLKFFITTIDPNELAGTLPSERDTSLRIGVAREWLTYITASGGIKVRVPPVVYAWIAAGTVWDGGYWKYYPSQKIYWDIKDKDGEITSFVADRWTNPWDVRLTSSLKWSRDKMESDDRSRNGEHGWQWDCGLIFGYARELLREPEVVRFMGGKDLARGAAVRLGLSGGPWTRDTISVLLLHKGQIRARWLYYFIEPEIQWSREDDWVRTIILTCGIEAIFWGGEDR